MNKEEFKDIYPSVEEGHVTPEEFHKPIIKMSAWHNEFWKEFLDSRNLTEVESLLLAKLSAPPKCMHGDPLSKPDVKDLGESWQCNRCGLIAKKSIEISTGIFINELA